MNTTSGMILDEVLLQTTQISEMPQERVHSPVSLLQSACTEFL